MNLVPQEFRFFHIPDNKCRPCHRRMRCVWRAWKNSLRRGIRWRRLPPSNYGRQLNDLTRKLEPGRAVDRLLVAGLIEARSCERFRLLSERVEDRELSAFYLSLFESEARHHSTYVQLAKHFAPEEVVMRRLAELSVEEARIIEAGDPNPRMHS